VGAGIITESRLVLNHAEPVALALAAATIFVDAIATFYAIGRQHFQTRENNNWKAISI
jgi:hypothetical protein